jgi:mannose-6-phosphate isomerase-like protein (cupin superfamily)
MYVVITGGDCQDAVVLAKHRMENLGKFPMLLIEVQIGSYLGEDDIIRYEDKYA